MRLFLILAICSAPVAAYADVIHLADGQVISGKIQSCEAGDIVVAPDAAAPVLIKLADVAGGEGADIERCLGGPVYGRPADRRWYGGQVILAEVASILLVPAGAAANSGSLAAVGLLGMALSPGIVHGIHGNGGRGFGSIGLHVGLGVAGAFAGAALTSGGTDDEYGLRKLGGAAVGLLVSQIVATTIDAASFAYEDPPPPTRVAVGVLFRDRAADGRRVPGGLALALRF